MLSPKDKDAVSNTKKAAAASTAVLKNSLLKEIETILDEEKIVKHSQLADMIEDVFNSPEKLAKVQYTARV